MPDPYQTRKIRLDFPAVGTPWQATVPHGLVDRDGNGIVPTLVAPRSVRVEVGGVTEAQPNAIAVLFAVDDTNITMELPPAADWSVPPTGATVWLHVERVHSIQGLYGGIAEPGPPPRPVGTGGSGPSGTLGAIVTVDDVKGNDTYPGTEALPLESVAAALAVPVVGPKRIRVAPGTYIVDAGQLHDDLVIEAPQGNVQLISTTDDVLEVPIGVGDITLIGLNLVTSAGTNKAALRVQQSAGSVECYHCGFSAPDTTNDFAVFADDSDLSFENCDFDGRVFLLNCSSPRLVTCGGSADVPGGSMLLLVSCTNVMLGGFSGYQNNSAAPNSHGVTLDDVDGGVVIGASCFGGGGFGFRAVGGTVNLQMAMVQMLGGGGDWELDATSAVSLYPCWYNPGASVLLGTITLTDNLVDHASNGLNPVNWVVVPTNMQDAMNRMAAAVAGLLGGPIP